MSADTAVDMPPQTTDTVRCSWGLTPIKNLYRKVLQDDPKKTAQMLIMALKKIMKHVVILVLVWLIVNLSVPALKEKKVYKAELWKWSLLVAMVSCGYTVISLATGSLLGILRLSKTFTANKNAIYYARGLRRSVNRIVLYWSILFTWIFYFRTNDGINNTSDTDHHFNKTSSTDHHFNLTSDTDHHFNMTSDTDRQVLIDIVTWTFTALSVWAVLWLLKSILILKWKADAVYTRFGERILNAGLKIYFLFVVCRWPLGDDQDPNQVSTIPCCDANTKEAPCSEANIKEQQRTAEGGDFTKGRATGDEKEREKQKIKAKKILRNKRQKLYPHVTLDEVRQISNYFVSLSKASSRSDDGTSDVVNKCAKIALKDTESITREDLKKLKLEDDDADLLYKQLQEELEHGQKQITYEHFQKWMVKAHENCLGLGHTLSDAIEVVKVLDTITTLLLIGIVVVMWLLLTDIANTKMLVLIASPFLGATFIFGDACKTTFGGIIFSFINHPFDVGDRCIIGGVELEVKRMGILATTFKLVETRDEVSYPNSSLALKSITNLQWQPNPNDSVELKLGSEWTTLMVNKLQDKIQKFFKDDKSQHYKEESTVVVKEIGETTKMTIQYRHVRSIQSHEEKRKQKSELLLEIRKCMEEIKSGKGGAEKKLEGGVAETGAEDKTENEPGEGVAKTGAEDKAENGPGEGVEAEDNAGIEPVKRVEDKEIESVEGDAETEDEDIAEQ